VTRFGIRPERLTHLIPTVTHVHIEQTDDGTDAARQVESADGTKTVRRFPPAVLPETVDGVVLR
jgi:hypothetical protein